MMESVTSMDTTGDFPSDAFDELEDGEVEDGELVDDAKDCEDTQSIESDKLTLRARRFGLSGETTKPNINPELELFHNSMGVDKDTRTEALHLLGTDNMKTVDVFAYFSGYSPASVEWISDKSCNVVWLDEESCAKALKNHSIKIKGLSVENDNSDDSEESINIEDIRCALPSGIWRKGHSNSLAPHLFIRYATRYDKKGMKEQNVRFFGNGTYNRNIFLDEGDEVAKKVRHETGNPWADIARQWSHFESRAQSAAAPMKDAREVLNHRDSKKTRYTIEHRLHAPFIKDEDIETKPSLLTSRKMQADIEEKKIQERNKLKSNLNQDRPKVDLRERLGRKRKRNLIDYDEPETEWKEDFVSLPEREDISLSIEIDNSRDGSDNEREDSRSFQSSDSDEITTRPNSGDLRSKLEKKKSSHHKKESSVKSVLRTKYIKHSKSGSSPSFPLLRIEIDNDVYRRSSSDEDED